MIQEFFSADIAHTRTEKVISDKLGKSLKQIFQCFITPSMDKGKFQVSVPEGDLLDNNDVRDYLKDLGYKIDYRQCGMNEYEYIIKW